MFKIELFKYGMQFFYDTPKLRWEIKQVKLPIDIWTNFTNQYV